MPNITSSFARDWQFVKISRNWRPHDFSKEVLEELIKVNDKAINERISDIAFELGKKEGREIKGRLGDQIEINTVIEGILLISGYDYNLKKEEKKTEITITKPKISKNQQSANTGIMNIPYIKGVVLSVIPESNFLESGTELIIYF